MPEEFCPRCQRQRTGFLQFCRGCGFDFEAPEPIEPDPEALAVTQAHAIAPESPTVGPPRRPRRVRRYVVIGTVALLGLSGLSALATPTTPDAPTQPSRPISTATALAPTAPAAPTTAPTEQAFGPTGQTEVGTVTRIVDGDTIRVEIDGVEFLVRYIGMDTPEPDAQEPAIKELADAATAANAALVEGREVILERDVSETDRFDRLLRDVWIEDAAGLMILVNLELIRQGFAQVSTYPPDVKYVDLLTEAQEAARTAETGMWAPAPTPTTLAITDDQPLSIVADDRERFEGKVGTYTWSALAFAGDRVTVRWSASAASAADCRVAWQIQPDSGEAIKSTIRVKAGDSETGNRRYDTPFLDAAFVVGSTCGTWKMSMQGYEAPTSDGDTSNCDSSYPDVCIPPYPPDLDCGQITERRFTVSGPDPHGFDSDDDGIGCESG